MGEQCTVDLEGTGWQCVDCIDLIENRGSWWAFEKSVMNLWVWGISGLADELLASQEGKKDSFSWN